MRGPESQEDLSILVSDEPISSTGFDITTTLIVLFSAVGSGLFGSLGLSLGWEVSEIPNFFVGLIALALFLFLLALEPSQAYLPVQFRLKKRKKLDFNNPPPDLEPPAWAQPPSSLFKILNVDVAFGLNSAEAEVRLKDYGYNEPKEIHFPSFFEFLNEQLYKPTQLLLLLLFVLFLMYGKFSEAFLSSIIISSIYFSEIYIFRRSKKAMVDLKTSFSPKGLLLRNGEKTWINKKLIVPGDIVFLKAGMEVPADLRLIQTYHLELDQSNITGESAKIKKNAETFGSVSSEPTDCANIALSSSYVTKGIGIGIAFSTGKYTEIARTTSISLDPKSKKTKLQKSIDFFTRIFNIAAISSTILIGVLGIWKNETWKNILLSTFTLIFCISPRLLPVLVPSILAIGSQTLSSKNIHVRKFRAVEGLNSMDCLLLNKNSFSKCNPIFHSLVTGDNVIGSENIESVTWEIPNTGVLSDDDVMNSLHHLFEAWVYLSNIGEDISLSVDDKTQPSSFLKSTENASMEDALPDENEVDIDSDIRVEEMNKSLNNHLSLLDPLGLSNSNQESSIKITQIHETMDEFDNAFLSCMGGVEIFSISPPWENESNMTKSSSSSKKSLREVLREAYGNKQMSEFVSELNENMQSRISGKFYKRNVNDKKPRAKSVQKALLALGKRYQNSKKKNSSDVNETDSTESKNGNFQTGWFGNRLFLKSEPESLLSFCSTALNKGKIIPIDVMKESLVGIIDSLSSQGLKMMAYAYRDVAENMIDHTSDVKDATFLGLLCFHDPAVDNAIDSIMQLKRSGIQLLFLSEDNSKCTFVVSHSVGFIDADIQNAGIYSCLEKSIQEMNEEDIPDLIQNTLAFSHTTPADKCKIVDALQANSKSVVYAGKDMLDAEVLSSCNIGIALLRSSDMVQKPCAIAFMDGKDEPLYHYKHMFGENENNLSMLVECVKDARTLFHNLRKAIAYYLGMKLSFVFIFLCATINAYFPLSPIHILLLNFFVDVGTISAFVVEKGDSDVMHRRPRSKFRPFFDLDLVLAILVLSSSMSLSVLLSFHLGNAYDPARAQTWAFLSFLFSHVLLAINSRTALTSLLLTKGLASNPVVLLWASCVLVLSALVSLVKPISSGLDLKPVSFSSWFTILLISFVCTCWMEASRCVFKYWIDDQGYRFPSWVLDSLDYVNRVQDGMGKTEEAQKKPLLDTFGRTESVLSEPGRLEL